MNLAPSCFTYPCGSIVKVARDSHSTAQEREDGKRGRRGKAQAQPGRSVETESVGLRRRFEKTVQSLVIYTEHILQLLSVNLLLFRTCFSLQSQSQNS